MALYDWQLVPSVSEEPSAFSLDYPANREVWLFETSLINYEQRWHCNSEGYVLRFANIKRNCEVS
jgi:hypothetical protein